MHVPLQLTARGFPLTQAIEAKVRAKAANLDALSSRITGCRVVLEAPPRHHKKRGAYAVRIALTMPGVELVVNHRHHTHLYAAIDHACATIVRRVAEYVHRRRNGKRVCGYSRLVSRLRKPAWSDDNYPTERQ